MFLCVLLMLTPALALAETMYVATSNGGNVNLRSGPSTDDEILTSIAFGQPVEVIEMLPGSSWVNVSYNGNYGYIMMRYLSYEEPVPPPVPNPNPGPDPTPTPRPNPNPKPTAKPVDTNAKYLSELFSGFLPAVFDAVVVPSTPTTYVNLRWAPTKSAPVRGQYWAGTTLQVLSQNHSWSEVYDPQTGTYGYMMSSFLRPVSYGDGVGAGS